MRDKTNAKYVPIQAKISASAAERVDAIVKKYDFDSRYELMQYLLSAFLRFADSEGTLIDPMDVESLEIAKIFEGFDNRETRVIDVQPKVEKHLELVTCISIYRKTGVKGYSCRRIEIDGENMNTTTSAPKVVEAVIKKLFPKISIMLEEAGQMRGLMPYDKILEALLSETYTGKVDDIKSEIRAEFSGNSASIEYGNVPKRGREARLK